MDDREIVSVLHQKLADKVGQDRFELWFNAGVELAAEGQTLLVLGGHAFTLERIRKTFRTELSLVANEVFGAGSAVEFRLANIEARPAAPITPAKASASKHQPAPSHAPAPVRPAAPPSERPRRPLASLDTYIVFDGNRLAHAAAKSISPRLGLVSPLFFHGPTGCGKSHLLEGICNATRKQSRERRVVSLSAEQFTSYFLEALQGSGLPNFRRKYRDLDLLVIDDVQFFAGKKATLVELQHTMDTLARGGKQMVLAADRPPAELQGLGAELVARMSGGLVCGLDAADEPTRLGMLTQFAAKLSAALPEDVLRHLAAQFPGDGRQLQGALHRIVAISEAYDQPITLQLAAKAIQDLIPSARRAVQLVDIERAICQVFGLAPDQLHAEKRTKKVNLPRMLAMWLARKYTRSALTEIGEYFGRRSHSTVIAAQNNVEKSRSLNAPVQVAQGECAMEDAIRRVMAELRVG